MDLLDPLFKPAVVDAFRRQVHDGVLSRVLVPHEEITRLFNIASMPLFVILRPHHRCNVHLAGLLS